MNKLLILLITTLVLIACEKDKPNLLDYDKFFFDPQSREVNITPETSSITISGRLYEAEDSIRIDKLKIVTEESTAKENVHYTLPEPFEFKFAPNSKEAQLSIELHPEKITSKINLTITRMEVKFGGSFIAVDTLRLQLTPEPLHP